METDRTDLLERFAELVTDSPHNLVSRRAKAEILTRHIPESVALAERLPRNPQGARLLDLGTGGGFPGMVIAIVRPDLEVHLLDSRAKKTGFLRAAAAELDVPVQVHTGRAEHLAQPPLAASFDLLTARAVAPLSRLVPLAIPFLKSRGVLYAVKGEQWAAELDAASASLEDLGAIVVATPADSGPVDAGYGGVPRVVMIRRDG